MFLWQGQLSNFLRRQPGLMVVLLSSIKDTIPFTGIEAIVNYYPNVPSSSRQEQDAAIKYKKEI